MPRSRPTTTKPWTCAGYLGGPGFFMSRAVRRAETDDAAAKRRCRRRAVGPILRHACATFLLASGRRRGLS